MCAREGDSLMASVQAESTVERWVTAQGAADHLSKPISWVRNNAAILPHSKCGNHLRFKLSQLDAWLESQA
jgi:hypothetical protein